MNEWADVDHALQYLARADGIPHRAEGEAVLLWALPAGVRRVLDLGCGDGRLLALALLKLDHAVGVALDFSPTMLRAARTRFERQERVLVVEHDLDRPLPPLGRFQAVVSSFAIHHLSHARKRALYEEVFAILEPDGVFANLEHVAPATPGLHQRFLDLVGGPEDPSNNLLDVDTQLGWFRQIGFEEVDCYWKWLELALLLGVKPG